MSVSSNPTANERPAYKRPEIVIGCLVLASVLYRSFSPSMAKLMSRWGHDPDYSHGYVVPIFAAYLLWHRREMIASGETKASWWAIPFFLICAILRFGASYYHYSSLEPLAILPCLTGMVLLLGGWKALHWAWPSIAFLVFMIPLPGFLTDVLARPLQQISTDASTFLIQAVGIPAVAYGQVIQLSNGTIGVVEACSGLPMLLLFFAVCFGASFVMKRTLWEKILVIASAVPIAVIANVIRISVTAVLYETAGQHLAELIFHDLAGWLMMPLAVCLLWLELFLLSKLMLEPVHAGSLILDRR